MALHPRRAPDLHKARPGLKLGLVSTAPRAVRARAPALRASEPGNPLEWAERDGDVATFRSHALFLPSTISYDARVRTVRAIIDFRPIVAARLSPDHGVPVQPDASARALVRIGRTGTDWASVLRAVRPARDASVEAVVVTQEHLLAALGWCAGPSPHMPVDRPAWRALSAHHDPRFALTIEPTSGGATLHVTVPDGVEGDGPWHLVAVAFGPGDALAGAAESYLRFEAPEG